MEYEYVTQLVTLTTPNGVDSHARNATAFYARAVA